MTLGTLDGLDAPSDSGASAVKTFQGTLASIDAALDGLTFQSSNFGNPSTLIISVDDQSPAGPNTATQTVTIKDRSGNDTPVLSLPGAQAVNAGTAFAFSAATGNAISIADGDIGDGSLKVTLSVLHGTLSLGNTANITPVGDGGTQTVASMSFSGKLADVNTALNTLTYSPAAGTASDTLAVAVYDPGPTGPNGDPIDPRSVSGTVSLTVAADIEGPKIAVPAGPLSVRINSGSLPLGGITLSDPSNGGDPETLTVYVSGGSLTFADNSGLSDGSTFGPLIGTLANLNVYFQNNGPGQFSFTPTPGFEGTAWIMITLDNGAQTAFNPATAWIPINVTAAGPTVAAPQDLATAPNTPIDFASSQVEDVTVGNSDPLSQMLEVFVSAENGLLSLPDTTGITVLAGDPAGADYLGITGTADAINVAIASMIYRPDPGFRGFDTLGIDVVNTGESGDITPPPPSDSTDDDGPSPGDDDDSGDASGPIEPVAPSPPNNVDASLVTAAIPILVDNPPVAVTAGGPYTIAAGGSLVLSGSAYDADGVPLSYDWSVNGRAGDGSITGTNPTLTWAQLNSLGITGAGTYSVTDSADDGLADPVSSAPVTLTVLPVAPVLSSVSATPASATGATLLTGKIQQPDPSESFSLVVSWGDGSVSTTALPAGASRSRSAISMWLIRPGRARCRFWRWCATRRD